MGAEEHWIFLYCRFSSLFLSLKGKFKKERHISHRLSSLTTVLDQPSAHFTHSLGVARCVFDGCRWWLLLLLLVVVALVVVVTTGSYRDCLHVVYLCGHTPPTEGGAAAAKPRKSSATQKAATAAALKAAAAQGGSGEADIGFGGFGGAAEEGEDADSDDQYGDGDDQDFREDEDEEAS